jgi:hypothetical protein
MLAAFSGPMWLRTGSASAASTSGATGVGPGIMSSGGVAMRRFMLPYRRAEGWDPDHCGGSRVNRGVEQSGWIYPFVETG